MYGWINECIRKLVLEKFGSSSWDAIIEDSGAKESEYLRYEYYEDSETLKIVASASKLTGIPAEAILETFGEYFIQYVRLEGYSNVLLCLGSTLLEWLSNVDMLHNHLEANLKKMVAPHFR